MPNSPPFPICYWHCETKIRCQPPNNRIMKSPTKNHQVIRPPGRQATARRSRRKREVEDINFETLTNRHPSLMRLLALALSRLIRAVCLTIISWLEQYVHNIRRRRAIRRKVSDSYRDERPRKRQRFHKEANDSRQKITVEHIVKFRQNRRRLT